jgi:hypothetical protein
LGLQFHPIPSQTTIRAATLSFIPEQKFNQAKQPEKNASTTSGQTFQKIIILVSFSSAKQVLLTKAIKVLPKERSTTPSRSIYYLHILILPERGVLVDLEALDRQLRTATVYTVVSVVEVADTPNRRRTLHEVLFGRRFQKCRRAPDRRHGVQCGMVMEPEPALDCGRRVRYERHYVQSFVRASSSKRLLVRSGI